MQDQTAAHNLTAPLSTYQVGGERFTTASPGFAKAVAAAHAAHQRPRCLCLVEGVEMYVARLGDGFIVKRMPNSGSHHATDCPSYEPPAEFSGLGQVLGSAIIEDPATGETTLKLDFSMSKIAGRSTMPTAGSSSDSVTTDGTKLSLRGLLHYLWDQAELTRWQPGFAGKRSWSTVRKHLLLAAQNKIARGGALRARLYIPEVFSVEQRNAINARRLAQWAHAVATPGKPQQLMLMISEVKEIVPARYGYKAVIKHVPDQAFVLEDQLYRRLDRRFEPELELWGASGKLHMMMIATFGVSDAGIPLIAKLSLMPVNSYWLPIEDSFEQHLIERLVREGRSFVKGLRYNLPPAQHLATAILLDTGGGPTPLYIEPQPGWNQSSPEEAEDLSETNTPGVWIWRLNQERVPPIPPLGCG
jgi:hypothetical protein